MVYHVINRGVGKQELFFNDEDYMAFERVIRETLTAHLMPRSQNGTGTETSPPIPLLNGNLLGASPILRTTR